MSYPGRFLARRESPRVPVEALCTEYVGHKSRPALALDLSDGGLKLVRPFQPGARERILQIELELPGVDEIVWAKGEICFDEIRRAPVGSGLMGLVRASGIRLAAAAARDLRMLRDFVYFMARERSDEMTPFLRHATGYMLG